MASYSAIFNLVPCVLISRLLVKGNADSGNKIAAILGYSYLAYLILLAFCVRRVNVACACSNVCACVSVARMNQPSKYLFYLHFSQLHTPWTGHFICINSLGQPSVPSRLIFRTGLTPRGPLEPPQFNYPVKEEQWQLIVIRQFK